MEEQFLLFSEPDYHIVAGSDEAGRGPLAGPVYAATVVLPKDFPFEILNDSKKLSEKKREYAEIVIKEMAVAWAVSFATAREIDKINILNASMLAMKRSFIKVQKKMSDLGCPVQILLVDGNKKPDVDIQCNAVIKGDSKIHEIMAASILAKTARDSFMTCAAKKWPQYCFEQNKGYPTKSHVEAIHKYGICPIHRLTFKCPD